MNDIAIRVENLSKQYHIGRARQRHDTLRDSLAGLFSRERGDSADDTFWALRDVSFEVKRGEVVGIIGRNGAGKSTLLKILSQITEPTGGRAEIHGRVGSLLEVGTGFHPELTGRENIYLNGAILGMRRAEIARQFDEIVAFAEIEKFLDTPVKRYSSGMYVRLAFAVASYLEPEILLIDEVLAVGDLAFQNKCLGRMGEVSQQGRTILFVSHSMPSIQSLTNRCILLDHGIVFSDDHTDKVVSTYFAQLSNAVFEQDVCVDLRNHRGRIAGMFPALIRIWITNEVGQVTTNILMGSHIDIHVEYSVDGMVAQPIVGITFTSLTGTRLFGTNNKIAPGAAITQGSPKATLTCSIPEFPLVAGNYLVDVAFAKSQDANFDKVEGAMQVSVIPKDVYGTGQIPTSEIGSYVVQASWHYQPI